MVRTAGRSALRELRVDGLERGREARLQLNGCLVGEHLVLAGLGRVEDLRDENRRVEQIADEADIAIGTLFLYASSKAELLIMVQNQKFEAAIDEGLRAADDAASAAHSAVDTVVALIEPVVACIREQPENGRTYLHELLFGDPSEPNRRDGLVLSMRLEEGLVGALTRGDAIAPSDAQVMARVITAIIHVTTTATLFLERRPDEILAEIHQQIAVLVAR